MYNKFASSFSAIKGNLLGLTKYVYIVNGNVAVSLTVVACTLHILYIFVPLTLYTCLLYN